MSDRWMIFHVQSCARAVTATHLVMGELREKTRWKQKCHGLENGLAGLPISCKHSEVQNSQEQEKNQNTDETYRAISMFVCPLLTNIKGFSYIPVVSHTYETNQIVSNLTQYALRLHDHMWLWQFSPKRYSEKPWRRNESGYVSNLGTPNLSTFVDSPVDSPASSERKKKHNCNYLVRDAPKNTFFVRKNKWRVDTHHRTGMGCIMKKNIFYLLYSTPHHFPLALTVINSINSMDAWLLHTP